ncbi:hypothetical protein FHS85_005034 [Rhodoligotrophos appendicifer]|uniref:VOC family protein n=1 Tax=Rhodoligotrophos appendicifer TaxID=987056 RepID=UPI001184B567|nr:VOC family protein [Rhodoligotrophos appendicifer]
MSVHGKVWWNELLTWDAETAKAFYKAMLGWSYRGLTLPDGATYWIAYRGESPVCGIYQLSSPAFDGTPNFWMTCIAVEDMKAAIRNIQALGGTIVHGPFHSDYIGEIALVQDGGGALVAFVEPNGDAVLV